MCAVDLTEVYSQDLFNERSMQVGLSTVAADLETGWNPPNHEVTNAAVSCESQGRQS